MTWAWWFCYRNTLVQGSSNLWTSVRGNFHLSWKWLQPLQVFHPGLFIMIIFSLENRFKKCFTRTDVKQTSEQSTNVIKVLCVQWNNVFLKSKLSSPGSRESRSPDWKLLLLLTSTWDTNLTVKSPQTVLLGLTAACTTLTSNTLMVDSDSPFTKT